MSDAATFSINMPSIIINEAKKLNSQDSASNFIFYRKFIEQSSSNIHTHTQNENIFPSAQLCLVFLCFTSMAHSHACAFYGEDFPGESENVLPVSGISTEWNRLWIEPY